MKWQEAFSVGIPEIDEQHKALVDCITLVEEAIALPRDRRGWSAVHALLGRLSDYVRIHFAVEESLMRIHGYPEFEQHAAEHREFAVRLKDLLEKSLREDVAGATAAFLNEWLRQHILVQDMRYARYLPEAGVVKTLRRSRRTANS